MSQEKRFVVTFVKDQVSATAAAKVMGMPKTRFAAGASVLESTAELDNKQVLHFEEIGASVAMLSEDDAEELRKAAAVAEVVEDFEVKMLGGRRGCGCGCGCGSGGGGDAGSAGDAGYPQAYWTDEADAGASSAAAAATPVGATQHCPPGFGRVCIRLGPWFPPLCFCLPMPRPPQPPTPPTPPVPPTPPPSQPIPWNITMVGADQVWGRVTGAGVNVAVLDTGIDDDHPDLTVSGGVSMVPGNSSFDDDQGHGTHCAGIIGARNNATGVVGVAPGCNLFAVKVLNANGSGFLSWILAGMGWAESNGMDVVSMSLGSDVDQPDAACTLAYQRAAERLVQAGCIVVAAAGNSGNQPNPWVGNPARCPGFMAVGAVDRNRNLASFSSRGPASLCNDCGVEIVAPGVSINSTVPGGGLGLKSGTSMACPHVSGAAALLKELRPTSTPAEIRARLRATAGDLGAPGNDPAFGSGLLDVRKAVFG